MEAEEDVSRGPAKLGEAVVNDEKEPVRQVCGVSDSNEGVTNEGGVTSSVGR